MFYVKWGIRVTLALFVFAFLHYTLPQNDVVRVLDAYEKRVDFGENSIFWASPDTGTQTLANRDVRFIDTVQTNGRVMVYRNEDTGWGWPPYFKLDSSNLNAEAKELVSSKEAPKWVVIRHYGWRNEFLTIYPNAVSVKEVSGPEYTAFPWLNTFILILLAVIALTIWRLWRNFRKARIDPVIEDVGDMIGVADGHADAARASARGFIGRIGSWLATWRKKPRS